jgi:hypothetical protein
MIFNETFDAGSDFKAISEEKQHIAWLPTMFFCRASILTSNNMTLAVANRNNSRIALSFRADEKVQTEMHLVRNGSGYGMTETSP